MKVTEALKENGIRKSRIVPVFASSMTNAYNTYYQKTSFSEVNIEHIENVEQVTPEDMNKIRIRNNYLELSEQPPEDGEIGIDDFYVSDLIDSSFAVTAMESIPAGDNNFQYDSMSMGTGLVRGILVMHPGYDRKEVPQPIGWIYLVNNRTGNRMRVNIGKDF